MDTMTTPAVISEESIRHNHTARMRTAIFSISPEWLAILAELSIRPRYVTELTCILNLPQPTVSNRLRNMRNAGLVTYTEEESGTLAPSHLYRLIPDAIIATAQDIRETARRIEETAARIESYVAKKKHARTA